MKNERWNPWITGFYFYQYSTGEPVLYIDRKRGYTSSPLNNCTKFKEEKSAKEHYLGKEARLRLCWQSPLDPYLLKYMSIR